MKNNSARSRRQGGLRRAAIMAALAGAALLAACSGGSPASAPGTGAGGPTVQQVDAYMQCMRSHGMANFYLTRAGSTAGENPSTTLGFLPYGVVNGVNFSSPQSGCRCIPTPVGARFHEVAPALVGMVGGCSDGTSASAVPALALTC